MSPDGPTGATRPTVRLVGKPLAPPWNDSSKNLARDLIRAVGPRVRFRVFGVRGIDADLPGARVEAVAGRPGGLGSSLVLQARLFQRLLWPERDLDVLHFFFSPAPRTAAAARALLHLRRCASVQTVVSAPRTPRRGLFFADRVVVLSRARRDALRDLGVEPVEVIPAGIAAPAPVADARVAAVRNRLGLGARPVVLFPGDWEFGAGWEALLDCWSAVRASLPEARLVLACREKTTESAGTRQAALGRARERGWATELVLAGEVDDMPALLAAAEVVSLPARTLRAKADQPLVLLEALALGRPVVVSDLPELVELTDAGRAGRLVGCDRPEELAHHLIALLRSPDERAALGRAGRDRVATCYNDRRAAERYVSLYQALARRGAG